MYQKGSDSKCIYCTSLGFPYFPPFLTSTYREEVKYEWIPTYIIVSNIYVVSSMFYWKSYSRKEYQRLSNKIWSERIWSIRFFLSKPKGIIAHKVIVGEDLWRDSIVEIRCYFVFFSKIPLASTERFERPCQILADTIDFKSMPL